MEIVLRRTRHGRGMAPVLDRPAPAWYTDLGVASANLRHYEHPQEKLSPLREADRDIEYRFGFQGSEWGELEGVANRTDFDLKARAEGGHRPLGFDRRRTGGPVRRRARGGLTALDARVPPRGVRRRRSPQREGRRDKRTVLRLEPRLSPVKAAVCRCRATSISRPGQGTSPPSCGRAGGRVRRRRRNRPPVPPARRDRYAVLRHHRARDPRGPGGDHPGTRLDEAGANGLGAPSRATSPPASRLLTERLARLSSPWRTSGRGGRGQTSVGASQPWRAVPAPSCVRARNPSSPASAPRQRGPVRGTSLNSRTRGRSMASWRRTR